MFGSPRPAAGVRDAEDAKRRRASIRHFTDLMSNRSRAKVTELARFLDLWMIAELDGPVWVAYPGWDSESYLARDIHPTVAAAKAAVTDAGGGLRPQRGIR